MTGAGALSLATIERRLREAFTAAGETVAPGSIRGLPWLPGRPEGTRNRWVTHPALGPVRPVRAPRHASRCWSCWPRAWRRP